jgi:glycosyltransferase involved in cell wall biosynthesis
VRVALVSYRSKPHCGGQGVYVRHLSRELVRLGHEVEVFSGQPYPVLDEGVRLTEVPSLDLYREPDPFRVPRLREFRDLTDVYEFAAMLTAAFPEPRTFSRRVAKLLARRTSDFDVVHDNQTVGYGMLDVAERFPFVETIHHPITFDRKVDLAHAPLKKQLPLRRWYSFLRMQAKVARQLPQILTVSESSRRDIATDFGVDADRIQVIPLGVDEVFQPPTRPRVPGRIVAMASADTPMKGVGTLLEAVAKLRTERDVELTVIGKPRDESGAPRLIKELGIEDAVTFISGVEQERIVELYAEAQVAVVPSLYEGFSLPAVEAMACGVPVVGTTGGAVPEVVGRDNETALIVPTSDAGALATAIARLLDDAALRDRIGNAGRQRVMERFTWKACAVGTAEQYRVLLESRKAAASRAHG